MHTSPPVLSFSARIVTFCLMAVVQRKSNDCYWKITDRKRMCMWAQTKKIYHFLKCRVNSMLLPCHLFNFSLYTKMIVETLSLSQWIETSKAKWFLIILECYFNVLLLLILYFFMRLLSIDLNEWASNVTWKRGFFYCKIITRIIVKCIHKNIYIYIWVKKIPVVLLQLIPFHRVLMFASEYRRKFIRIEWENRAGARADNLNRVWCCIVLYEWYCYWTGFSLKYEQC